MVGDINHAFLDEMKWQIHLTWKDIDQLKWLNGKMVNGKFPMHFPMTWKSKCTPHVTWKGINWLRWLNARMTNSTFNGKFPMHFPMTWRSKSISSYDIRRHWLVEMTKCKDDQ
jgi:hypothetical protein